MASVVSLMCGGGFFMFYRLLLITKTMLLFQKFFLRTVSSHVATNYWISQVGYNVISGQAYRRDEDEMGRSSLIKICNRHGCRLTKPNASSQERMSEKDVVMRKTVEWNLRQGKMGELRENPVSNWDSSTTNPTWSDRDANSGPLLCKESFWSLGHGAGP